MSMAQEAAPSAVMTPIYLLVGAFVLKELLTFGRDVVRGAFIKNEQAEVKEKEKLSERLDKHDEQFSEQEDAMNEFERSAERVERELKGAADTLAEVRTTVNDMKRLAEERVEKQGEYYRKEVRELMQGIDTKLGELEFKMRQELTRTIPDHVRMQLAQQRKKKSS